jgi:hypothetical protein
MRLHDVELNKARHFTRNIVTAVSLIVTAVSLIVIAVSLIVTAVSLIVSNITKHNKEIFAGVLEMDSSQTIESCRYYLPTKTVIRIRKKVQVLFFQHTLIKVSGYGAVARPVTITRVIQLFIVFPYK